MKKRRENHRLIYRSSSSTFVLFTLVSLTDEWCVYFITNIAKSIDFRSEATECVYLLISIQFVAKRIAIIESTKSSQSKHFKHSISVLSTKICMISEHQHQTRKKKKRLHPSFEKCSSAKMWHCFGNGNEQKNPPRISVPKIKFNQRANKKWFDEKMNNESLQEFD